MFIQVPAGCFIDAVLQPILEVCFADIVLNGVNKNSSNNMEYLTAEQSFHTKQKTPKKINI